MTQLKVRGVPFTAPTAAGSLGAAVTVEEALELDAVRGGGEERVVEITPEHVVELELEDGAKLWLRGEEEELRAAFQPTAARSGGEGPLQVPAVLPLGDAERGAGAWTIKALKVLGIDLVGETARALAGKLEERALRATTSRLMHWHADNGLVAADSAAPIDPRAGAWLLFIHGTNSNTLGSFGDLPERQGVKWRDLHQHYEGRVLAFEHRTLTESPIRNVRNLLETLPVGAQLDVLSYSRGGLVAELLGRGQLVDHDGRSRAAFNDDELALFKDALPTDYDDLLTLNELFARKRPSVVRHVRVACPTQGTKLLGGRLDRWLNLTFNVAKLALGGRLNPVAEHLLDGVAELIQAIVKERSDPKSLPGLAAMSSEYSPLIRVLNRQLPKLVGDLIVVGGDSEPSGALRRVALWFADLYFGEDHDLVVDTASMVGGLDRTTQRRVFVDSGRTVAHFNYFANEPSSRIIADALLDTGRIAELPTDVRREKPAAARSAASRGADAKAPVVFVLPGIGGSHLAIGNQRIWIDLLQLLMGGVGKLRIQQGNVNAEQPIDRYYKTLLEALRATHRVVPWPYDWRRSLLDAADRFGEAVKAELEADPQRSVRIVAHSMGGLVARVAFAQDQDLWEAFRQRPGSRFVMLGTPNGGSFSIPLLLLGRHQLLPATAFVDCRASVADQLKVIAAWPAVTQMLPHDRTEPDLWTSAGWEKLRSLDTDSQWTRPTKRALDDALEVRKLLKGAAIDSERMVYVAGQADTYAGIRVDPAANGPERIQFKRSPEGDGAVLWASGIPDGMRVFYARVEHGNLARDRNVVRAISDLLDRGTTSLLPTRRPEVSLSRGLPEWVTREEAHEVLKTEEEILGAVLASGAERLAPMAGPRVHVRVVHGHLKFAAHPVMVGHYIGDTINGSEEVIDTAHDHRLTRRRERGLHPGPVGTFDVFLNRSCQPQGSVIVGLGQVSELTAGRLEETLRSGLLALGDALEEREQLAGDAGRQTAHRGVSAVLVGSGGGILTLRDAVTAMLQAIDGANHVLGNRAFEELEIIEAVEQRAISAWHAVRQRIEGTRFGEAFLLATAVEPKAGGWRRVGPDVDKDYWLPITIAKEQEDPHEDPLKRQDRRALRYVVIDGHARIEARLVATRRRFVERFVRRVATREAEQGKYSAQRTLFELLWPNALKERSLDDRNIRLILDDAAAALPWEMLDDRRPWVDEDGADVDRPPPAARYGIVRQLVEEAPAEDALRRAARRRALLIANPRSPLPELKKAEEEVEAVAKLLRTHGYVGDDILVLKGAQATPEKVVAALLTRAWQIVHIAAHGVVDHHFDGADTSKPSDSDRHCRQREEEGQTGVVLGGEPPDVMVLDTALLSQMPISAHLFFVNCCHLAEIPDKDLYLKTGRPQLASSIALQLMRQGTRAVIAAGWEVNDTAACDFATEFYSLMLAGAALGEATKKARRQIYERHRGSNTWGAYQCYGTPDFRLHVLTERAGRQEPTRILAAPAEAVAVIERIGAEAEVGAGRNVKRGVEELTNVVEIAAARGWLKRADVLCAFGAAYAQLDDFDKAIEYYGKAVKTEKAHMPLAAVEQRLNLIARRAARRRADPAVEPAQEIETVLDQLQGLNTACGTTAERLNLIGSAHKRMAMCVPEDERTAALDKMAEAYAAARKFAEESGASDSLYSWSQELLARAVLFQRKKSKQKPDVAALRRKRPPGRIDDFWDQVCAADLLLIEAVADGELKEEEEKAVVAAHKRAWSITGSRRQWASVVETVDFILELLGEQHASSAAFKRVHEAMIRIADE